MKTFEVPTNQCQITAFLNNFSLPEVQNFLAAASLATENGEQVLEEPATAAGDDGWLFGQTCSRLLVVVGGEPSDVTVVQQHTRAESRAVPSSGIAEVVTAGTSMQRHQGWRGVGQKRMERPQSAVSGLAIG